MALSEATPTLEELQSVDLPQLVSRARAASCFNYANEILDPRSMGPRGSAQWRARALLGFVTSLRLDAEDDAEPFKVGGWFGELSAHDLSAQQLAVLQEWLPEVADVELTARIADILWSTLRPRDHRHGRIAVDAYVRSATRLAAPEQFWCAALENLRRAAVLARKFDLLADVVGAIEALVDDGTQASEGPRDARLLRLLLDTGGGDPAKHPAVAEARADEQLREAELEDWGTVRFAIAREFLGVAADWHLRTDPRSERAAALRLRAAETYVLEADKAMKAGRRHEEASLVGRAVVGLRRAGGQRERVDELTARMVDARRSGPWVHFSVTEDLTEQYVAGRRVVRGRDFRSALLHLAYVTNTPSASMLREMALEHFGSSVVTRLFSVALFSPEGLVAKHVPAFSDGENENEAALRSQMWQECRSLHAQAFAFVNGARHELLLEHNPTLADLAPLVRDSWLVPYGHELLFARGLLAGLYGDFIVASHILIPQFENGLRVFVEQALGKPLVSHGRDGTQSVGLLNRILSVPELGAEIGEDLVFDLQGLLVRPDGANLRNRLAHGLIRDRESMLEAGYFWWLCLRLTIWMLPSVRETRRAEESEQPVPTGKWTGGAALVIQAGQAAAESRSRGGQTRRRRRKG